jgi:hypothetical protein
MSEKRLHRVRFWMTRAYFGGACAGMLVGLIRGGAMFTVGSAFCGALVSALAAGLLARVVDRSEHPDRG